MVLALKKISKVQTEEIEKLVKRCESLDGYSACIRMDHGINFYPEQKSWFLYYENESLVGVASILAPVDDEVEISVCVKQEYRRKGIGSNLVRAAVKEADAYRMPSKLLVFDQRSKSGLSFADRLDCKSHHEDITLQSKDEFKPYIDRELAVRVSKKEDKKEVIQTCMSAYEDDYDEADEYVTQRFESSTTLIFVGLKKNKIMASCFVESVDGVVTIVGVAIKKSDQGKGYGKKFLRSVLGALSNLDEPLNLDKPSNLDEPLNLDKPSKSDEPSSFNASSNNIQIEVESLNERAYQLYLDLGFVEFKRIVYYQMG